MIKTIVRVELLHRQVGTWQIQTEISFSELSKNCDLWQKLLKELLRELGQSFLNWLRTESWESFSNSLALKLISQTMVGKFVVPAHVDKQHMTFGVVNCLTSRSARSASSQTHIWLREYTIWWQYLVFHENYTEIRMKRGLAAPVEHHLQMYRTNLTLTEEKTPYKVK
jgi:hypothetical protein